ncbi:MAG TPA: pirin family protein [Thermoanaerobaculia bacterium]|nr:pirin family protein [Thermoanaerobaculia bacterium]
MINVRKSGDRGHFDHGWLNTYHTFSFADYYDPAFMGFRTLRVINEDRVQAGAGFGTHGHRDMEIVSYVLEGALAHRDSMGHGGLIRPGDVQRMSAGTGVLHSETNGSKEEEVHFLQIWILPEERGIAPSYEQKHFDEAERRGVLRLVASPDASDGSLKIHQDTRIYSAILDKGARVTHELGPSRHGWLQVAAGEVEINGQKLSAGDGAAISGEKSVVLTGSGAEVLLFDLA